MPTARRLIVHGHVQGVFFRDSVRREAARAGVSGWARNRDDGTVEVHLEGDPAAVAEVERFCAEGPPRARVARVEARDVASQGGDGFRTG